MSDRKLALAIYLFCTAVYAATAGQRLLHPSSDTHFVYQAESWLGRRLDLGRSPPHQNDWADVEYLKLRDGTEVAGQPLRGSPGSFRTLKGQVRTIAESEIAARTHKYYVSFPPFPAVLMLPIVALAGQKTNDVLFTVLLAGLVPALLYLLLRRLPRLVAPPPDAAGRELSVASCLWLVAMFAFGSVYYFSAVLGQVWFTAHIVSLVLCGLYLLCALPARRPILAGLCVGAMYLTRPQMAALGLLFVLELLALHEPRDTGEGGGRYPLTLRRLRALPWGRIALPLGLFLVPCALLFGLGSLHNIARFARPLEFGHTYLTTMQADNIQRYGLMNYQYLPRNLATALCLLPKLLPAAPFLQVSNHGLALWFTTPALFYLLWPEPEALAGDRRPLALLLAACVVPIALASLLYQNTGYIQFGYRFSLDYMLPLVLLLALVRPRAIATDMFRIFVIWGIVVNLFGAITFGRLWQFYFNSMFPVP